MDGPQIILDYPDSHALLQEIAHILLDKRRLARAEKAGYQIHLDHNAPHKQENKHVRRGKLYSIRGQSVRHAMQIAQYPE